MKGVGLGKAALIPADFWGGELSCALLLREMECISLAKPRDSRDTLQGCLAAWGTTVPKEGHVGAGGGSSYN